MTFLRSGLEQAFLGVILLCLGCSSSESGGGGAGAGGQSGERGGQGGAVASTSGGASESESAGAGGDSAGSAGDESEGGMSNGGTAQGGAGGTVVVSSNGGGAGSAGNGIAGSAAIGGASGSDECSWDPVAIDTCPVCDGSSGCERPGYKYMGSGAITSSCCGLQWQEEAAPGKYTWSQANEYCASLSLLDLDWRLPKIAELDSLVLLGGEPSSAAIDVEVFADTLREAYWSSSLVGKTPQVAWCVNFSNGSSQSTDLDGLHRVRCVR